VTLCTTGTSGCTIGCTTGCTIGGTSVVVLGTVGGATANGALVGAGDVSAVVGGSKVVAGAASDVAVDRVVVGVLDGALVSVDADPRVLIGAVATGAFDATGRSSEGTN
jgi:hypothetical protein